MLFNTISQYCSSSSRSSSSSCSTRCQTCYRPCWDHYATVSYNGDPNIVVNNLTQFYESFVQEDYNPVLYSTYWQYGRKIPCYYYVCALEPKNAPDISNCANAQGLNPIYFSLFNTSGAYAASIVFFCVFLGCCNWIISSFGNKIFA